MKSAIQVFAEADRPAAELLLKALRSSRNKTTKQIVSDLQDALDNAKIIVKEENGEEWELNGAFMDDGARSISRSAVRAFFLAKPRTKASVTLFDEGGTEWRPTRLRGGSIEVGCRTFPKEAVQTIRNWALRKEKKKVGKGNTQSH